jgi:hypothetical protein
VGGGWAALIRNLRRKRPHLGSTALALAIALSLSCGTPARAGQIAIPAEAKEAMDDIYSGRLDAAEPIAHQIAQKQPDHPLGFLLEAETEWWRIYCEACTVKWGMIDDFAHGKKPSHDPYLALADQVIQLAQQQLAKSETAEMHVYAGLGYALKARIYDERDDRRNVARSGVSARAEFVRALQLDPDTPDATAGLGLYNYYVDTLSSLAKILRFFMGIPGGSKQEGIREMRQGMERGVLFNVDTRFYLAKNLRTFDLRYQDALDVAQPLVDSYPRNPIFALLAGNLSVELGRNDRAGDLFRSALAASGGDPACADRVREIASSFLAKMPPPKQIF